MVSVGSDKDVVHESTRPSGRTARDDHAVLHSDGDRYYARERLRWLRKCLDELGESPAAMLDFGCSGVVTSAEYFDQLSIRSLVGVEVTAKCDDKAASLGVSDRATFVHVADYRATESMDLAFTHGVIPHMSERDRAAAAVLVFRSLKSGGLFAFWHHNPWSPRARLTVNGSSNGHGRAFAPPDARRLLRGVGFDIVHTTSTFYFPRTIQWCRPLEPMLATLPLGREYMVLARKP
jgi:predicted TPR repeat methyltransferase